MRYLRFNTAARVTVGPFLDKSDGITPEVALTVTSEKLTFVVDEANVPTLILDVAPTASAGANDMVHITGDDAGYYDLELAAADTNHLGRAMLSLNDVATHCPVFHEFMIIPQQVYDSLFLGTDALQVHVNEITNDLITAAAIANGAIDAATFAANAINAAAVDPDVTTEIQTGLATAANIADAILDEALAGHTTAGTLGKAISDTATKAASLTFTKANELDVNVQSINGATATGDGSATPFNF